MASLHTEFAKCNMRCIALVCETVEFCERWIKDTHNISIGFPIISDNGELAISLQILDCSVKDRIGNSLAGRTVSSLVVQDFKLIHIYHCYNH